MSARAPVSARAQRALLGLLLAASATACTVPSAGAPEATSPAASERLAPSAGQAVQGGALPGVGAAAGVTGAPPPSGSPPELELLDAGPIEGPPELRASEFQPSGLLLARGRLLAVSDRQDAVVFELESSAGKVRALPWLAFRAPVLAGQAAGRLDFEGLALDGSGALLLLSEALVGLLRVVDTGSGEVLPHAGRASWLPLDSGGLPSPRVPDSREGGRERASLRELGRAAGLFQVAGADLEGVAALPGGELLFAAERQPRGLIELGPGREAPPEVWSMPDSAWPMPRQRPADFSDLSVVDGQVYALVRNAHLVVRLERTSQGWREQRAWSYAAAENDPRFVYADTRFGLGEGLAIGPHEVFIVLDNNGQSRRAAPTDQRALLFRFARPSDL